jgi:hypothetical protein
MVKKCTKDGVVYHEPPYTEAEQLELYRRMGGVASTVRRPDPRKDQPKERQ